VIEHHTRRAGFPLPQNTYRNQNFHLTGLDAGSRLRSLSTFIVPPANYLPRARGLP
jgi:hypothetical protein